MNRRTRECDHSDGCAWEGDRSQGRLARGTCVGRSLPDDFRLQRCTRLPGEIAHGAEKNGVRTYRDGLDGTGRG